MKKTILFTLTLALSSAVAAPKGEITVWSWDVAAKALEATIPSFNKKYPDVKVKVVDLGNQNVYDRGLAGCAAGGADLPDVYSVENGEAEVFWARFPDCFTDLTTLGAGKYLKSFPAFKWTELSVGNKRYAMPWDSGPVVMFYRRDLYKQAGVSVSSIKTWDDFIKAGQKVNAKFGGKVKMGVIGNGSDDEWFRMLANQNGCFYFDNEASEVTINKQGCVDALTTIKKLMDAKLLSVGDWGGQITAFKKGDIATSMFGAWYEGTIRSNGADLSGKWGVYAMPASKKGGVRAANLGGSALALPASSKNKEAAYAFIEHALATNEGQIAMLKQYGLVPSLLSAAKDPYVAQGQKYWGNQKVWKTILDTLGDVPAARGTQFFQDARQVMIVVQADFLAGKYKTAKEALDAAAKQISSITGLPIAK
ncbi:ABC transporter substrate-binding protein [Deinococcus cellulosilyticus]|uniref:ABC transporter substrate-binding protein n=1 Tax=Deinococcus cellulosilyticus (strain DSM 18568 / NBRC 106333 / KACC 11606 / 5516J-15) TaxID=1223518 RepID=A0A511MVB0_DEIC1|nr:sugar ABC transporter substrate-binding protein [Deinococcus cellulosilyticus]GEM44510.1 ABC transporter substrate-binding protein [Deinococcus cellulosilyticus NBRC 106333 = KACC 11606]